MKKAYSIAVFISAFIGFTPVGSANVRCAQAAENNGPQLVEELSQFYALISVANPERPVSDSDKALLLADFKAKLADVENALGRRLMGEILARVEVISSQHLGENAKVDGARTREMKKFEVLEAVFRVKTAKMISLNDIEIKRYLGEEKPYTGHGVQFSADDRFMFFRNAKGGSIFDTVLKRLVVENSPRAGLLSEVTNDFLEISNNHTIVHDLISGKARGTVDGIPILAEGRDAAVLMNEDYIVTKLSGAISDKHAFAISEIKTGKRLDLGEVFSVSHDLKTVVRQKSRSGVSGLFKRSTVFEIVEVATEKVIRTFEGKAKFSFYGGSTFIFERSSKSYLLRLSDLREFEVPHFVGGPTVLPDEKSIVFTIRDPRLSRVIYNLEKGSTRVFSGYKDVDVNARGEILLTNTEEKTALLFTDSEAPPLQIDAYLRYFSRDGRWLYGFDHSQNSAQVFDLRSGTLEIVDGKVGEDSFVPNTDSFLLNSGAPSSVFYRFSKETEFIFLFPGISAPSPMGTYLVTIEDGLLKLLEFGNEAP